MATMDFLEFPQATVLGPLLFLLYIKGITEGISSEICLFIDFRHQTAYRSIQCGSYYHRPEFRVGGRTAGQSKMKQLTK